MLSMYVQADEAAEQSILLLPDGRGHVSECRKWQAPQRMAGLVAGREEGRPIGRLAMRQGVAAATRIDRRCE
jgi:hypothetical protein